MERKCPNCGCPTSANDKFCNKCGHKLPWAHTRSKSTETRDNAYRSASVRKNSADTSPAELDYDPDVYIPDRGWKQKFFTTKGRLNPARYVLRLMFLTTLTLLLSLAGLLIDYFFKIGVSIISSIPLVLISVLIIPLQIRRAHDMGRSGWYGVFGMLPIIGGGIELLFRKVHWTDKWGNYHERDRFDENGALPFFFYVIIASTLAALYFMFSSGMRGTNQYGADPNGKCADIPLEENRLLRAISKIEEGTYSGLKTIGIFVCIIAISSGLLETVSFISKNYSGNINHSQSVTVVEPKPQLNEQLQSATPPPVADKPPQPQVVAQPLTNDNQRAAFQALINFHAGITNKNFQSAYDCFSRGLQNEISYEGWTPGFSTTVSSNVSEVRVVNESPNAIELSYVLTAVDNINGRESVAKFNGTVTVINEDGQWKLDFIKNKVR